MKRQQFTQEEKSAYFQNLRSQWQQAKVLSQTDELAAVYAQLRAMGIAGDISLYNISLIFMQAQALGLDGLPYVDFKTYEHWKKAGFQVRKGEKSPVFSLTWIGAKGEEGEDASDKRKYPKLTHLFHSSQVEPLTIA